MYTYWKDQAVDISPTLHPSSDVSIILIFNRLKIAKISTIKAFLIKGIGLSNKLKINLLKKQILITRLGTHLTHQVALAWTLYGNWNK